MAGSEAPAPLDDDEIAAALRDLPGFAARDGALRARYRFADFAAAFAFLTEVAAEAERMQHHPDWSNSYAEVTVALRTHDEAAITDRDVRLARAVVALAGAHGARSLPLPTEYPRDLPPMWFLLAAALVAVAWIALPTPRWIRWPWNLSGAAVALLGLGCVLWAAGLFRRRATGIRPFTPARVLVADGPFRFSRNPMYLGMVAMVAGLCLAAGTPWPWPVAAAFAVLLDRRFVRREEEFLAARFGNAYSDFRRRVRRWL